MSYASSAGSHRLTGGQDVLRGVDVPVGPGAARGARPVPRRKAQLREQVPARRAGRAGRVPAVNYDQLASGALAFVLQLVAELAPAAVGDGLCELAVADHVLDGKILDHDHVVAADQTGAGTVQEITPGVADLAVGPGDLRPGLSPVGGAALVAGQAPLIAGQVPRLALQVPRVGDPLPVRRHGEVLHAEVDAGGVPGGLQRLGSVGVDGEGHVPAAVRLAGHHYHRRVQAGHVHV